MTGTLEVDQWIDELDRSYWGEYLPSGGSSVKFAVCLGDVDADSARAALLERATAKGFLTASLSAADTKIHFVEQVFAKVADQIPWDDLTNAVLCQFARDAHWTVPDQISSSLGLVEQLEAANGLGTQQISLELQRRIGEGILRDRSLAKDFRVAMMWLARARLEAGPESDLIRAQITDWLGGRVPAISGLRRYQIYTKVNRANARHLLGSLLAWIHKANYPGLVVAMDARRLLERTRADDGTFNYTKAGLLDSYEVLRQFVDATDEFDGLMLAVLTTPDFLDLDSRGRGLGAYTALMHRVYDEVRDRNLANPLTALIRLGASTEEAE